MNLSLLFINSISLLIFFILYKNINLITEKLNLFDYPDKKRKLHKKKTSLIGGLMIFLCLLYLIIVDHLFAVNENFIFKLTTILVPIFIVGLLDDMHNFSPVNKLILKSFLILFFLYFNKEFLLKELYFDDFKKTYLLNDFFSYFITILCLLLLINAFNMSDGINGLALSISVSWLMILIALFDLNITFYFIAIIIFLSFIFNYQGKFFLGNSGSLLVSCFIGLLSVYLYNCKSSISVEKIILLFLIPGLDMLRLFILRISNNKSPFSADTNHFHHYLIRNFCLHIVIIIYLLLMLWPFIFIQFYKVKYSFLFLIQAIIFYYLISYYKNKKVVIN